MGNDVHFLKAVLDRSEGTACRPIWVVCGPGHAGRVGLEAAKHLQTVGCVPPPL